MENITITEIKVHKLDEDLLDKFLDFQEKIHDSYKHNDVLRSRPYRRESSKIAPVETMNIIQYISQDTIKDEIIGFGFASYREFKSGNQNERIWMHIAILPEYRRRGIGTTIMKNLLDFAKRHKRPLIEVGIYPIDTEDSEIWLKKLGFKKVLQERINRLKRENINYEYIAEAERKYGYLHSKYKIVKFDHITWSNNILSDDNFAKEMAEFYTEAEELLPMEDAERDNVTISVEDLRISARKSLELKDQRGALNYYAKDGNKFIAMSGTYFTNDPPLQDVGTGLTAVRKAYQRQGLATLLKVLVTKEYFSKYPELQFITTENAGSNKAMLKINQLLGYEPVDEWHMYQARLDDIKIMS